MDAVTDRHDYEDGWAALADPGDARPRRRRQLGAGALLALAGAMGVHTADAKAMLPADGGGGPATSHADGGGKASTGGGSKSSGGGSTSAPPTHTDASDGYAGMHPARSSSGSSSGAGGSKASTGGGSKPSSATRSPHPTSSPPARTDASDGYSGLGGAPTPVREGTRSGSPKTRTKPPKTTKPPSRDSGTSSPPARTDVSDGYSGLGGAPSPVLDGTRSDPPARSAPPPHTDASDGYAGLNGRPRAKQPRRAPVPTANKPRVQPGGDAGPAVSPPTHTDASDGYAGLYGPPTPVRDGTASDPPGRTDASDGYAGVRRPQTSGRTDAADGYYGLGTSPAPPSDSDALAGIGASGTAKVDTGDSVGDKIMGFLGGAKDTVTDLPGDVVDGANDVKDFGTKLPGYASDGAGAVKDFATEHGPDILRGALDQAEEHAFDATPLGPALTTTDAVLPGFKKDFGKGAIEDTVTGLYDLGKSGFKMGPVGSLIDPDGAARERDKWKKTGIYAYKHPLETLKAVSGYDQVEDGHPGRAAGGWLPTLATLPFGGEGALSKIPSAANGLNRLSRLSRLERGLNDLDRLAPKKLPEPPKPPKVTPPDTMPPKAGGPKIGDPDSTPPRATTPPPSAKPPVDPPSATVTPPRAPNKPTTPLGPPKPVKPPRATKPPAKPDAGGSATPPAARPKPGPAMPAKRPTWRESEQYVGDQLGSAYRDNKVSYLDGKVVPYGTKGSSRPDFTTGPIASGRKVESFEVKNYKVSTASGRSRLAGNIAKQAAKGKKNLPPGSHQQWVIDARGQGLTRAMADKLAQQIVRRSNGNVKLSDIDILR